jgi:hypothetical protein
MHCEIGGFARSAGYSLYRREYLTVTAYYFTIACSIYTGTFNALISST